MKRANPTIETQKKIISVIENSEKPISITSVAKLSKTGFNEAKASIEFLHNLGIVELIVSSGNSSFVILNKSTGDTNANPRTED